MDFTSRLKIYQTHCKKEDKESMCWNKNTWDFSCNLSLFLCHFLSDICHFLFFSSQLSFVIPKKLLFIILLKEFGFERSPLTKRQSARFVLNTVFSTFPEHKFWKKIVIAQPMNCAGANLVPCRGSVQASDQYILWTWTQVPHRELPSCDKGDFRRQGQK